MVNDRLGQLDGPGEPDSAGIRQGLTEAMSLMLLALQLDDQEGTG